MINLFIYRNTFLAVDLYLNESLFQMNGIFSIITFLPGTGERGFKSSAGVSSDVLSPERRVAKRAVTTMNANEIRNAVAEKIPDSGGIT